MQFGVGIGIGFFHPDADSDTVADLYPASFKKGEHGYTHCAQP